MNDLVYTQPSPRRVRKKPGTTARYRARRKRASVKTNGQVREYIFQREQGICRCCRIRRAESMHELRFRSLGGKVSRFNSVALCGDGTRGCHGFLQRLEIDWASESAALGAEWQLSFQPNTNMAAEWMRVKRGLWIVSLPSARNDELETC